VPFEAHLRVRQHVGRPHRLVESQEQHGRPVESILTPIPLQRRELHRRRRERELERRRHPVAERAFGRRVTVTT
jgi:hypothetical protein